MVIFYSYPALTNKAMGILPVSPLQIDPVLQHEKTAAPIVLCQSYLSIKLGLLIHIPATVNTAKGNFLKTLFTDCNMCLSWLNLK